MHMIVINRNGERTVITGWRAWMIGFVAVIAAWLILALLVFVWIGVTLTVGLVLLLAAPALAIVALLQMFMRR